MSVSSDCPLVSAARWSSMSEVAQLSGKMKLNSIDEWLVHLTCQHLLSVIPSGAVSAGAERASKQHGAQVTKRRSVGWRRVAVHAEVSDACLYTYSKS